MESDTREESPLVVLTVFREHDGWMVSEDGQPLSRALQRDPAVDRAHAHAKLKLADGRAVDLIVETDMGGLTAKFMRPARTH